MKTQSSTQNPIRISAAARRLGISAATLRRWEREQRIPPARRNRLTGQRLYEESDCRRLLDMIQNGK